MSDDDSTSSEDIEASTTVPLTPADIERQARVMSREATAARNECIQNQIETLKACGIDVSGDRRIVLTCALEQAWLNGASL